MGRRDGKSFTRSSRNHRPNNDNRGKWDNRHSAPRTEKPAPNLNKFHASTKEDEIGITEYVTASPGFTGIIKHRISDFHVNEIGFDGKLCKLTDLSLPETPKDDTAASTDSEHFKQLISLEKFNEILEVENADKKCDKEVLINVTKMEKNERTLIHHTIKEMFTEITSTTVEKDDEKFIKCTKQNKRNDRRTKWLWPHEYTYFLLHKDNIDTMQAVSLLAPLLNGARASSITYAGTKDKRAKTTQWACIRRRDPAVVVRAARRLRNITVGNFMFRDQPLKLGQLKGNRFRVALRQINVDEATVNGAMEEFREKGFINYYGLQRFGNHSAIPTHRIGLALLKADYKLACELIMKPRDNDIPEMQIVRKNWWEKRDADEALNLMYRNSRGGRGIEYKLLTGFSRTGASNYVSALDNLPRNVRLMYIHAYQSLVWNEMVSRRIAKFGLQVCEGDLVFSSEDENAVTEVIDDEAVIIEDGDADDVDDENNQGPTDQQRTSEVKVVTKADVDSNSYTIFDVILPLPGHDVLYPANECAEWYKERLAKDELTSEKLKQKNRTYSLAGTYRKIMVKPSDLQWHLMRYKTDTDTLIQSDLEEIRKEKPPASVDDGPFTALVLEFTLPSSTYATMALREILKSDTSVASQVNLHESVNLKRNATTTADDVAGDTESAVKETKKPKIDESN